MREEPAPLPMQADDEHERRMKERRGTEAVEGEVEMDRQGEGFVNMGLVKVITTFRMACSYTQILACMRLRSITERLDF